MKNTISLSRRQSIANLIKRRRNKLQPEEVGLPRGTRRRIPGLRREEVSSLAGLSTEWYTWLEQGRNIRASAKTLLNISNVLKMDPSEQALLLSLSGHRTNPKNDTIQNSHVSPRIQALLDQQYPSPAYVTGPSWDILAWNEALKVIFPDVEKGMKHRNALYNLFMSKSYRKMLVDWEYHAKGIISKLHSINPEWLEDPWYMDMIKTLKSESREFSKFWNETDINGYKDGEKSYEHPQLGRLNFEYTSLKTIDENYNHLRIMIYLPKDTKTEMQLSELLG